MHHIACHFAAIRQAQECRKWGLKALLYKPGPCWRKIDFFIPVLQAFASRKSVSSKPRIEDNLIGFFFLPRSGARPANIGTLQNCAAASRGGHRSKPRRPSHISDRCPASKSCAGRENRGGTPLQFGTCLTMTETSRFEARYVDRVKLDNLLRRLFGSATSYTVRVCPNYSIVGERSAYILPRVRKT